MKYDGEYSPSYVFHTASLMFNNWAILTFGHGLTSWQTYSHNGINRTCNFVCVDQISPNADGTFTIEMQVGGDLGKVDGLYLVHNKDLAYNTDEVMIEIVNGAVVPEFGSAAIIVLVVAIVSIVAICTRMYQTKHSTIPSSLTSF